MTLAPAPKFIHVQVDEHDAIPDGCSMRFKAIDEPRAVRRVKWETEGPDSPERWIVESADEGDAAGPAARPALAATVEDSGAGVCTLVYGGSRGLRLRPAAGGEPIAEPYLLLAPEAVLEWG
jgi:hypothetical protein